LKKFIAIFLLLALVCFTAAGCGAKDKLEEKMAEELTEAMLEQGGAEDVEIDGDKVTITGEDGEKVSYGGGEWPDSDLVKNIPEFKKGKLASTVETTNYLMVSFEEVDEADAVAYIEKNKPDFTVDHYESKAEDMISFAGSNEEGLQLTLTYTDTTFTIMLFLDE
jgi:predicted small lipoprotein YifL